MTRKLTELDVLFILFTFFAHEYSLHAGLTCTQTVLVDSGKTCCEHVVTNVFEFVVGVGGGEEDGRMDGAGTIASG